MMLRQVLVAGAVLLTLAGCGEDDSTGTLDTHEQKAAQALSAHFQGKNPSDFQRDTGVCMGKRLVDQLGNDRLIEGGLLTEDLTVNKDRPEITDRDIAERYAAVVISCQDARGEIESRRDDFPKATDADIDTYVTCVESIDEDLVRSAVIDAAMRERSPSTRKYAAAMRRCTKPLS